jgi:hypothetical protein
MSLLLEHYTRAERDPEVMTHHPSNNVEGWCD